MLYKIINPTEQDERNYLEHIKNRLQQAIKDTDAAVEAHAKEIQENKNYLWENKAGMDHAEKVSVRESVTKIALTGENAAAKKNRLAKLIISPYFGRVDFTEQNDAHNQIVYIGIYSFFDTEANANLIHDWRAPIASMFYDFEPGKAFYNAPAGKVEGIVQLKRQYRIRKGEMEFMLQSAINIHDDVLQKELSQNSSDKMKNIVATIQREQNAIIRNEDAGVLIIQGVAGSGKTSIALHRIAFLLYRFKETIKSEDILIISPNKVFADYISNVLPELGEESICETSMEDLANDILESKYKFQSFFEQVASLTQKDEPDFKARVKFKSGFDFINKLDEFLIHIENNYFTPKLIMVNRYPVPETFLEEKYKSFHRLPLMKRIQEMAQSIAEDTLLYYRYELTAAEKNQLRKDIRSMFKNLNLRAIYKDFYDWLQSPEMLKYNKRSQYEYADVFPLIYLKIKLEGNNKTFGKIKHLVVDEMQDYTPVQYRILSMLFPCNKTILGDYNQSVNPYATSDAETIAKVFPTAERLVMRKSYRSSYEISEFAQKIRYNPDLELIERHGEKPCITKCRNKDEEIAHIQKLADAFVKSSQHSLGIICKTQQQADALYKKIKVRYRQITVLNEQSTSFSNGIIIATAYMVKGLEFDNIIIPFCSSENYQNETDRQMLYVAATRAMHKLNISHTNELSTLIQST